jgi:hypothetical protein
MKTNLIIWHNSEGADPVKIMELLSELHFRPVEGHYDYEYDWESRIVSTESVVYFCKTIHEKLKGTNVYYKIETIREPDEEIS